MVTKTCDLVERLKAIPDPRRQGQHLKPRLEDLLLLGFCGTLAGCDDFVEIADGASDHLAFLSTCLELPNGIPSPDTFHRVLTLSKPATLQAVILPWLLQRRGLPGDWLHVDGQTLRHTRHHATGLGALHVLSAWAGQAGLTLGQVAVEAKATASTAMPQLLELLDLRDKLVTADAMNCQQETAQSLVEAGGDYLLAVKAHQPTLHAAIQAAFAAEQHHPTSRHRKYTTEDKDHGRHELRTVQVLPAARHVSAEQWDAWVGLVTLVMVVRVVTCQATQVVSREVS